MKHRFIDAKNMEVMENGQIFREDDLEIDVSNGCYSPEGSHRLDVYLAWVKAQPTVDAIPTEFLMNIVQNNAVTKNVIEYAIEKWEKENE